jgi:hypothetical protein
MAPPSPSPFNIIHSSPHTPQATNPNGYWQLNMNQACYEGEHWYKWTPIGIVMSIVICLGIPLATFLPVFLNRKTLTTAKTQVSGMGCVYIKLAQGPSRSPVHLLHPFQDAPPPIPYDLSSLLPPHTSISYPWVGSRGWNGGI